MDMKKSVFTICAACVIICGFNAVAFGEETQYPDPKRWENDAKSFAKWDQKNTSPADPVVFVGSSSIRMWPTADSFPGFPVINRGFGGSIMADSVYYLEPFVLKYKPHVVVVYAGDNDCAANLPAESIANDFKTLTKKIHAALPDTEIICLSIKRSGSRKHLWPLMQKVNDLYKQYSETKAYITYVDVDAVLHKGDQGPIPELYLSDHLHLSDKGYAVWNKLLTPIIKERYRKAMSRSKD